MNLLESVDPDTLSTYIKVGFFMLTAMVVIAIISYSVGIKKGKRIH
jgi:hypothetical protein